MGVLEGAPGTPKRLLGCPKVTLERRASALGGLGRAFEPSKMVRDRFFEILEGQIHIFPRFFHGRLGEF